MIVKKILPEYFYDILLHNKRFEIRKNDCDYKVGDKVKLILFENNQTNPDNYFIIKITYVLKNIPEYGLDKDYCIFGFKICKKVTSY